MTTDKLKPAAEFLAGEALMGWEQFYDEDIEAGHYWGEKQADGYHYIFDWLPYADTKEGWWQTKMVFEKMRERGWLLTLDEGEHTWDAVFYEHHVGDDVWVPAKNNDPTMTAEKPGAAIVLAAATALGWKEE